MESPRWQEIRGPSDMRRLVVTATAEVIDALSSESCLSRTTEVTSHTELRQITVSPCDEMQMRIEDEVQHGTERRHCRRLPENI